MSPGQVEPQEPWPFKHPIEELDVVWDAFMDATVTEGHPLHGKFMTFGLEPQLLSHLFDLVLTASEET